MRKLACRILVVTLSLLLLGAGARARAQEAPDVPGNPLELYVLVSDTPSPVVRMRVMHTHGGSDVRTCYGYLDVSRDSIRYEEVHSNEPGHSFQYPRAELATLKQWMPLGIYTRNVELKFRSGPNYHFGLLSEKQFAFGLEKGAYNWKRTEYLSDKYIIRAIEKFDEVVEELRAARRAAQPPGPVEPVFKLLDPAGAESGKPVAHKADSLRLRGLVSHPAGVASLSLNGANLPLAAVTPQTALFDAPNQPVRPGSNEFLLLARSQDQKETRFSLVVLRPTVRLLEPAKGETSEATATVRGVVVSLAQVTRAEVAGRPASLQPQPDGSTEFTAREVPLVLGSNSLDAVFTGAQGEREVFPIALVRVAPIASAAPAPSASPGALSVKEVEDALRKGVPAQRVTAMVTLYGVDFTLTEEIEQRLRAAGAGDALLLAISKARK